jgi:hypothetical protein
LTEVTISGVFPVADTSVRIVTGIIIGCMENPRQELYFISIVHAPVRRPVTPIVIIRIIMITFFLITITFCPLFNLKSGMTDVFVQIKVFIFFNLFSPHLPIWNGPASLLRKIR